MLTLAAGCDATTVDSATPAGGGAPPVCGLMGMRGFSLQTGGFLVNVLRLDAGLELSDSIRPDATLLDCRTMCFVLLETSGGAVGVGEAGGVGKGCSSTAVSLVITAGTGSEKDVIFSTSGFWTTLSINCSDFFSKFSRFFICSLLLVWFATAVLRAIPAVSTWPFRIGETKLILGQSDVAPLDLVRAALFSDGADWPKGRMVTRGADVDDEVTRVDDTP